MCVLPRLLAGEMQQQVEPVNALMITITPVRYSIYLWIATAIQG